MKYTIQGKTQYPSKKKPHVIDSTGKKLTWREVRKLKIVAPINHENEDRPRKSYPDLSMDKMELFLLATVYKDMIVSLLNEKTDSKTKKEPRYVPRRNSKKFNEWCIRYDKVKAMWRSGRESYKSINDYLLRNYPDLACQGKDLDTLENTIIAGDAGYLDPLNIK